MTEKILFHKTENKYDLIQLTWRWTSCDAKSPNASHEMPSSVSSKNRTWISSGIHKKYRPLEYQILKSIITLYISMRTTSDKQRFAGKTCDFVTSIWGNFRRVTACVNTATVTTPNMYKCTMFIVDEQLHTFYFTSFSYCIAQFSRTMHTHLTAYHWYCQKKKTFSVKWLQSCN